MEQLHILVSLVFDKAVIFFDPKFNNYHNSKRESKFAFKSPKTFHDAGKTTVTELMSRKIIKGN